MSVLPIVVIHGIFGTNYSTLFLAKTLENETGRKTFNCEIGNGPINSVDWTIDKQAQALQECIQSHPETGNGFIGVGHSQGALIIRHFLEFYNFPPVKQLISLSGPLGGFYCNNKIGCFFGSFLPDFFVKRNVYSSKFQNLIGATNYWRDPLQLSNYVANSMSLALLNNERDYNEMRRQNFISLEKLVCYGSANDSDISPWQSAHFGVFADNSTTEVIPMEEQEIYKNDSFGLKTLNEAGKLKLIDSGMQHNQYLSNEDFIRGELSNEIGRIKKHMISSYETTMIVLVSVLIILVIGLAIWLITKKSIQKSQQSDELNPLMQ